MFKGVVIFALLALKATAWWCTGHQLVAQVAYNDLKQNNPSVLDKAEEVLKVLDSLTNEPSRPFVEAACWPDQIKDAGIDEYNEWHYDDLPIFAEGFSKNVIPDDRNSNWALHQIYSTLKSRNYEANIQLMKSFSIRLLLHIVGDVHQPLHSSSYFSPHFPDGDEGGNLFKIKYKSFNELHALWDAACDKYGDGSNQQLPLTSQGIAYLENEVSSLTSKYTRDYFKNELKLFYFDDWIQESRQEAVDYVYKGLTEGEDIPDSYISQCIEVAQKRITLGGYRLANVLNEIYGSSSAMSDEEQTEFFSRFDD